MIKKIVSLIIICFFFLAPARVYSKSAKKMSSLQIREFQTRVFETSNTQEVLKASINTLQDSGFVVHEIEPELGFIRAEKSFKKKFINKKRVAGNSFLLSLFTAYAIFSYGSTAYYVVDPAMKISNEMHDKTVVITSNITVTPFGKDKTKVRMVMVEKFLVNADGYSYVKSAPMRIIHLNDENLYREFFAQLDKNIFYERI